MSTGERHGKADERTTGPPTQRVADSRPQTGNLNDLQREGSGYQVSADQAAASASWYDNRPDRPHLRRRIGFVERVWRTVPDPHCRTARKGRPEVHALSYDRALLADAGGAPLRPQSSRRRHGRDY